MNMGKKQGTNIKPVHYPVEVMDLALELLDIKLEYDEMQDKVKKLDEKKKKLAETIIKHLGENVEKNNSFFFPERKCVLMIDRYDSKVYEPEIEAEISVLKDEIKNVQRKAEREGKLRLIGSYRVNIDKKF